MSSSSIETTSNNDKNTRAWTKPELLDAWRNKRKLHTVYPGMTGIIENIRSSSEIVMKLSFGATAYLQVSALGEHPPFRYHKGTRVNTSFGKGIIMETRINEERIDYVVSLIDCHLANDKPAIGYFSPDAITLRLDHQLSFAEVIEDSTMFRNRGNDAFKTRDYDTAITEYKKCVDVLGNVGENLTEKQKLLLLDAVVKALSNTAQCMLSKEEPSYTEALRASTEALRIDIKNITGQRSKLLYRRACAFMGLKEWASAVEDLKDSSLNDDTTAQSKLKEATKYLQKEKEGSKKFWGKAFSPAATALSEDTPSTVTSSSSTSSSNNTPPVTPGRSPVRLNSTLTSSPSTTGTPNRSIGSSTSSSSSSSNNRVNELRSLAGDLSKDKELAEIKEGIDNPYTGNDATLEKEGEDEDTSGNWTNYLLYGTIGLSALALGAYALSRTRK